MRFKTLFFLGLLTTFILQFSLAPKSIKVLNFDDFEPHLHLKNDSLYIINFWATWCTPCVKELPYFQDIANSVKDKKVKFLLVSLDFPKQIDTRLIPFLERNNIDLEVLVLDDPNQNVWIDKVHKDWSGAIPATLIYNKEKRDFYEKAFTYEELENIINSKISNYENN
jgi:thiol-disulfide isomerase/thioredoxin